MIRMIEPAFIICNGKTRGEFDLTLLKGLGSIYGANALYRDFPDRSIPDILVSIDAPIHREIMASDFPKDRYIHAEGSQQYEPAELGGNRGNAGLFATQCAIDSGHKQLYFLGFDSLLCDDNLCNTNAYAGSNCYTGETSASVPDTRNRLRFLAWMISKNPDVSWTFVFPKDLEIFDLRKFGKISMMSYDVFEDMLASVRLK